MEAEQAVIRRAQAALAAGAPLDRELESEIARVFDRHRPRLVQLCRVWTRDPERGEELAQDAIATAWSKLPAFRVDCQLISFLAGIARHLWFNSRRKMQDLLTEDGVMDRASEEHSALSSLAAEERASVLYDAIRNLPPLEQDVLHRRYTAGMSYDEITADLGLDTSSGARGLLARAKRRLLGQLREALLRLGHGSSFFQTTSD